MGGERQTLLRIAALHVERNSGAAVRRQGMRRHKELLHRGHYQAGVWQLVESPDGLLDRPSGDVAKSRAWVR
jgi:hypothetical protein